MNGSYGIEVDGVLVATARRIDLTATPEPNITSIEYVDYSAEYGLMGKIVARSDVRGMSREERDAEVAEMLDTLGRHDLLKAVEVETIPATGDLKSAKFHRPGR